MVFQRTENKEKGIRYDVKKISLFLFLCLWCQFSTFSQNFSIKFPDVMVTDVLLPIVIKGDSSIQNAVIKINNQQMDYSIVDDKTIELNYQFKEKETLIFQINDSVITKKVEPIPLWMSILPPLIAILLAFIIKEVYISLFAGILTGTTIISFYAGNNFLSSIFIGLLRFLDTFVIESMLNFEHLAIIVFSILIGGMVQIISANGGMSGLIAILSKRAKTATSGQLITWLLGILIFFDDYANSLVIGNTMRPITDRLKISREKLSYIVDSTAAPVATIAFITTWIGAQLTYIQDGLDVIGLQMSPYNVFLNSLQYAFYPILTLLFILILIFSKRDFGPMLKVERKARQNAVCEYVEQTHENSKKLWSNAVFPILVMIFGTLFGLYFTGKNNVGWNEAQSVSHNISSIMGAADNFRALLWASLGALLTAVVMSLITRRLSMKLCMEKMMDGFKMMLPAVVILILAWAIAHVTKMLFTAEFFSGIFISLNISCFIVPALAFVFAFIIAFSTGTSWGTMAILYPLILPTSWIICSDSGISEAVTLQIFYNVTASVLAGAVFGDHCSPISDTTILSSLSSSCNHIDHVRTQMPYAMTVGIISLFFGILLSALHFSLWIIYPLCFVILFLIVRFIGKKSEE